MGRKEKDDGMDGAKFIMSHAATPADYIADPVTGLRPHETKKPNGSIKVYLDNGIQYKTIPPRWAWKQGKWKEETTNKKDWNIWVTPGEGTPGNYATREHVIPEEIATVSPECPHPSTWAKKHMEYSWMTGPPKPVAPSLPFGLRFRCIGCGHWFKESDLKDHVKSTCPATNGDDGDWALACECCTSLDDTVKMKPGFPRKPKAVAETEKEKVMA